MMTVKTEPCHCDMKRIDRKLKDGFEYYYYQCSKCARVEYPVCQAQKLYEYAEEHQFMFIDDWILAWLYIGDGAPILGITKLQKELFVILMEFAQENDIPSENPGFRAYKFGPYTERIDRCVQTLMEMGWISSIGRVNTDSERFILTEDGMPYGKKALSKLTDDQVQKLRILKGDIQQFSTKGIMTYVYKNYPEYTNESVVFERTLHRKRK